MKKILLLVSAMVVASGTSEARSRRMPANCTMTGAHYNALLSRIEKLEAQVGQLRKRKPALASKVRVFVRDQRVRVYMARIRWLKRQIARLKRQIARLRRARLDPTAKKAAIVALKAKIAKYERELRALKRRLALLPLNPSSRPIVDAASVRVLTEALDGLRLAVDRLIKRGLRAPELEKRLDKLLVAHKLTQEYLVDVTSELSALRRQLKKGIIVHRSSPWPNGLKPNWAGWHFTGGIETGFTLLSGAPEYAVPMLGVACSEYVHSSHFGLEACLKAGVLVTKVRDSNGKWYRVSPFMLAGSLAGIARWNIFGITIPKVEVGYVQSPLTGQKGLLWVNVYGGIQLTLSRRIVFGLDLGTSLHSDAAFLGGMQLRFFLKGRY